MVYIPLCHLTRAASRSAPGSHHKYVGMINSPDKIVNRYFHKNYFGRVKFTHGRQIYASRRSFLIDSPAKPQVTGPVALMKALCFHYFATATALYHGVRSELSHG